MYCTKCGTAVQDDATFCTACGAQVGAVASTPPQQPQPAAPQPAAAPQPQAAAPSHATVAPVPARKRTGLTVAAVLGVVLMIAVAGIGVGYWLWSTPPTVDADMVESFVVGETVSSSPSSNPVNMETPEGGYAVFLQSLFGRQWGVAYDHAVPEAREWIASREAEASGAEGPLMEPTEAAMSEDGVVTAVFHNLDNGLDYRYILTSDAAGEQAGFVIVEEIIGDGDPLRTRVQMVERDGRWLFAQYLGPVE